MWKTIKSILLILLLILLPEVAFSQDNPTKSTGKKIKVTGTINDEANESIIGANVLVVGTTLGTITDINGKFSIEADPNAKLKITYIGYDTKLIDVNKEQLVITLTPSTKTLDEVVVVGYGQQKKASVVGAITTTSSKELERTGGVPNMAMALTGNLAGVTTIQSSSQPGRDDPKIFIRGQSTWNGGEPYILVDGVERRMNDLDMSEVANISVLKDASATAVYGVKGANGVILITTKRGTKGKPVLSMSYNSTLEIPSLLVDKLDSYNTLRIKNQAIEREISVSENSWIDYMPMTMVERYRNQQSLKYPEAYPNIDWRKETIKDFTTDHRFNLNLTGGTDFAKYFTSVAYLHQGDLMKIPDNDRGYTPGLGYDKFNVRANLDLNLTKTTVFKINIAGVYSTTKQTYAAGSGNDEALGDYRAFQGVYSTPPNAFMPRYSDGYWGRSPIINDNLVNGLMSVANAGIRNTNKTDLTTDFGLTQKLDFITQGLSFSGNFSFDNHFETRGGIWDNSSTVAQNVYQKYIDPKIEDMLPGENPNSYITYYPISGKNQFDFVPIPWTVRDEGVIASAVGEDMLKYLRRRLFYQAQLNYANTFGKHDVTATGVFNREQMATGSEFQHYREDWVFRATYNYDGKYFGEFNGAYNGSERFGINNRFAFFPSAAVGWTISNEKFMKDISWLDKLRLRYSLGKIGDDGGTSQRWLYATQWSYGGSAMMSELATSSGSSPYKYYKESVVGNPDIQWETAIKSNLGLEFAVLKNFLSANIEYFTEDRSNILLDGSSRILPSYFGATPSTANVGRVTKKGYEIELRFNKNLGKFHLWLNTSMTHAVDRIISKEEPQFKDAYLKAEGYQIDQTKTLINNGYYNNWDEIYASTPLAANDKTKLPGNYNTIDFNADGVINSASDRAPFGFSTRPQNTYNLSFGADYKGFSAMLQFYGVNNVSRVFAFNDFNSNLDIAWPHSLDYWSKDNQNATSYLPRWKSTMYSTGNYFLYDGSYLRLKTVEFAYTFTGAWIKKQGLSSAKLFVNGNNLFFWSKMPDDREQGSNVADGYPSAMRINMGVDVKF
jgi:TonB-linked SusC/RagA family outer membrane protein